MVFRDPRAISSALTELGMLQPKAFMSLNPIDPYVSMSHCCLENQLFNVNVSFKFINAILLCVLLCLCGCGLPRWCARIKRPGSLW